MFVLLDEVDPHYEHAREGGAEIIEELADNPTGHRRYGCRDPQGHEWYFAQEL